MKICEQILKKKTAPQYNSNSLNCKKLSRTSPEKQFKELNEKLRNSPPDQQIN